MGQPANPLDELEALAEPSQEPQAIEPTQVAEPTPTENPTPQPTQNTGTANDTTDDGLTPLQRAIKAKNEASGIVE